MVKIALSMIFGIALAASAAAAAGSKNDTPPGAATAKPAAKAVQPLEGEPTLARIDAGGTLRVGVAINPPWVMHGEGGDLIGYSVDIANKLGQEMGWQVKFVETSWPRLLYDLRTDQFDVVISGLSITPQRARLVQFTSPVGEYDIDAIVNRSRPGTSSIEALAEVAHARIAAHKGEVTVDFARTAFPKADVLEVDDEEAAIADVRSGKFDAYVAEAPMPHLLESSYPELHAIEAQPIARTAHGFAVRKNDVGLRRVLDAWIVYEQASGWLKTRSAYWFSDTVWANGL